MAIHGRLKVRGDVAPFRDCERPVAQKLRGMTDMVRIEVGDRGRDAIAHEMGIDHMVKAPARMAFEDALQAASGQHSATLPNPERIAGARGRVGRFSRDTGQA